MKCASAHENWDVNSARSWYVDRDLWPGPWQVVRVTMDMQRTRDLTPLATALEVLPHFVALCVF